MGREFDEARFEFGVLHVKPAQDPQSGGSVVGPGFAERLVLVRLADRGNALGSEDGVGGRNAEARPDPFWLGSTGAGLCAG